MAEIKNVTITHKCDKCGKEFEKGDYRFDFSGPGYARDRADYVFIKFDLDIWYGGGVSNADICPDCAKEILKGVLKKLEDKSAYEKHLADEGISYDMSVPAASAEDGESIAELKDKLRHYPMMVALIESYKKENAELRKENADVKEALERQKDAYLRLDDMYQRDVGIVCKAVNPGVPCAQMKKVMAENAELKELQRWRKFREEKPKEKQWIQVYHPNHSQFTAGVEVRRWDEGCKYDVEVQEIYEKWMPLPKEPED